MTVNQVSRVTLREGAGGRREQTEKGGVGTKAGRGHQIWQHKQGEGLERLADRRLVVDPDRSLRPCGGPPTAPVVDAVIGDVPAVRVVAVRSGCPR